MAVKKVCTNVLGQLKSELKQLDPATVDSHVRKFRRPYEMAKMASFYAKRRANLQSLLDDANLWRSSEVEPVITDELTGFVLEEKLTENGWLYQNCVYEVTGTFTDEEKKLLIMEHCDKERQKFERLKAKFNSDASQEIKRERLQIPEEVRIAVWRRDQGKCVRCGGRENLEYDHIVPVSKGGSNTVRNVELLCEACNRQKGNRIQ